MKYLSLLLTLICTPCLAQIEVDETYSQYQPVEIKLQAPEGAQALWEIKPLGKQKLFTTRQYGDIQAFWGEPGKYEVEATVIVVDFDAKTLDVKRYQSVFEILGSSPVPPTPPGPGPEPDNSEVPEDPFDNLGRRIDAEADKLGLQQDVRTNISNIFLSASRKMMEPGGFVKLSEARDFISSEYGKITVPDGFDDIYSIVKNDGNNRTLSWEEGYLWYRAVAAGYKGGKI